MENAAAPVVNNPYGVTALINNGDWLSHFVLIVLAISPAGQVLRRDLLTQWDVVRYWIAGLF